MSDQGDGEKPNIHVANFNQDADQLAANLAKMKRTLPSLLEAYPMLLQMKFAYYQEALRAGFDPKQALELTKDYLKGLG